MFPHSARISTSAPPIPKGRVKSAQAESCRSVKLSEADRHERALKKVAEIDPEVAERLMNSLKDIAPDLAIR